MLNDHDAVVQFLFADHVNEAVEFYNDALAGSYRALKKTRLIRLKEIWERVLPDKELIATADAVKVKARGAPDTNLYDAADMSDGERAIFYMLGQVLSLQTGDVIVYDEPELHIHRAILGRLWDEISAARPDCALILITHDLKFAALRPGRKFVLRGFAPPDEFSVSSVPEMVGFDESLVTLILGSRLPVLFVEGTGDSLDTSLYRSLYPNATVLARGGCEEVIRSVRIMRANQTLTRVICAGLVDADSRNQIEIDRLNNLGISVLPVSEIENLFALPIVARAILRHYSFDDDTILTKLEQLKVSLFQDASQPGTVATLVNGHVRRYIDKHLKLIDLNDFANIQLMQDELTKRVSELNLSAVAEFVQEAIESSVKSQNLERLLTMYDNKNKVLTDVSRILIGSSKTAFVDWVRRVVQDEVNPSVRDALTAVLPCPHYM